MVLQMHTHINKDRPLGELRVSGEKDFEIYINELPHSKAPTVIALPIARSFTKRVELK